MDTYRSTRTCANQAERCRAYVVAGSDGDIALAHQCVRPTSSSRFLLAKPARVITVYDRPPSHVIPDIPKASTLMDIDGNYSARLHAATLLCPRLVVGGGALSDAAICPSVRLSHALGSRRVHFMATVTIEHWLSSTFRSSNTNLLTRPAGITSNFSSRAFLCLHLLLGTLYLHTFVLSIPYPPLNAT